MLHHNSEISVDLIVLEIFSGATGVVVLVTEDMEMEDLGTMDLVSGMGGLVDTEDSMVMGDIEGVSSN